MTTNRMLHINSLINEAKNQKLTKQDISRAVDMLYKSVDLNVPDDFAIEMIMISMEELEHMAIDKKQAKEILKAFDKKHTRVED